MKALVHVTVGAAIGATVLFLLRPQDDACCEFIVERAQDKLVGKIDSLLTSLRSQS